MLYHDSENIAALTLLLDHLYHLREDPGMFSTAISTIKTFLFVDTPESDQAQARFEQAAYKNRGETPAVHSQEKGGSVREISVHRARVYLAVKSTEGRWITNEDVYALVPDVAQSLIRHTTLALFKAGLVERVEGFPLFRYRWSTRREGRNHELEARIKLACEAYGLPLSATTSLPLVSPDDS